MATYVPTEASLAQADAIQARLSDELRETQNEIDTLRAELRRDQEPARMQLIQELIAVSWNWNFLARYS